MKCSQKTCKRDATCSYIWPGNVRKNSCTQCAVSAQNIAKIMGFPLELLTLLVLEEPCPPK